MTTVNPEHAFIERVTESQGIIHKVCNIYCKDIEYRKDLFQEILIQLWKSFPSFRGDAQFSTWMYKVSLNVALQYVRRSTKKPSEVELNWELNLTDVEEHDIEEDLGMLYKAIDELQDVEKAIVMLYLDDKGNDEIAEIIGISQNYVRVKMNRIKTKLRKLLNADTDGNK